MALLQLSIQIRIMKQVLKAEEQRQMEQAALFDRILHTPPAGLINLPSYQEVYPPPPVTPGFRPGLGLSSSAQPIYGGALQLEGMSSDPGNALSEGAPDLPPLTDSKEDVSFPEPMISQAPHPLPLPSFPDTSTLNSEQVLDTIAQVVRVQNTHDHAHDTAALRQLLRRAVATNDDMDMLKVLQVRKEEMPEAIKALQRAREVEIAREREEKERAERERADALLMGDQLWSSPTEERGVDSLQRTAHSMFGSVRRDSAQEGEGGLRKAQTFQSVHSDGAASHASQSSSRTGSGSTISHDTLDREFIESSIDSLVRLSTSQGTPPASLALPWWSITRYEVIRDLRVGVGSFSEVWKGSYRGRTVAVKVLAPWTSKELFKREVDIWKDLRHPNVLELIGASTVDTNEHTDEHGRTPNPSSGGLQASIHSAMTSLSESGSGWDVPEEAHSPWFFVSRYYERGNLVKWVKNLDRPQWEMILDDPVDGILRMIHEIVRGMVYLHSEGILHGDLKACPVAWQPNSG